MSISVRGKLFIASLAFLVSVGLPGGVYLEHRIRGELVQQIEARLLGQVRMARVAIQATGPARLDTVCRQLGEVAGMELTVIDREGRALCDSGVDPAVLGVLSDRPEVADAWRDGVGIAERWSTNRDARMLYAAMPFPAEGSDAEGLVRMGMPLREIDAAVGRLRLLMAAAGVVALAVAVAMSGLASELLSRALRELVDAARKVSRGAPERVQVASGDDEVGKLAGSFNRLADEAKRLVQKLARERDRLDTVLRGMSEGVLALDAEGRLKLANPAAGALLGVPIDRQPSPEPPPLVEVVRVPALLELAQRALDGERAEDEIALPTRPVRRVLAVAAPLQARGGCVIVLHDVTEIRRLEAVRRDFVANVSHELRTPLSVIRANAETLLDGALDDRDRAVAFVSAIHRSSERLARLVADLLDLARIEAGRQPLELEAVSVAEVAALSAAEIEGRATSRGLTVAVEVASSVRVTADADALQQVLVNLLDNAVNHTPEGGHVTLRAAPSGDSVRIEVEDDGPGIAPDHRARVFERFYRVDDGRSRDQGGTGLGLAIVKHLASQMQGIVGVDAAAERGSIFWVRLPPA